MLSCFILSCLRRIINGGGSSSSESTDDWASLTGDVDTSLIRDTVIQEFKEGCEVAPNTLLVSGDFYDKIYAWIWNDDGNFYSAWPGPEFTSNDISSSCSVANHFLTPPAESSPASVKLADETLKSLEGAQVIVSNGDGKQTGDGNVFTQNKPCLLMKSESEAYFVNAQECGAKITGLDDVPIENEVYAVTVDVDKDGNKKATVLADGTTLSISELAGDEKSGYLTLNLLIKGLKVDAESKGTYWFGDNEDNALEFSNSAQIQIGKNVALEDGEEKEITLHIKYTDPDTQEAVTASYIIKKTYSVKNAECRLKKQDNTLGATYSSDKTIFRIWSPDSSNVKVNVDGTDYDMTASTIDCYTKVYEVSVDGDLAGKTYQFSIDGKDVRDPYGKMVSKDGKANIVMDMSKTDPDDGWADTPALKNREDSIVYEVHVRDFTIDATSGVDSDKQGRYLGMVQTGTKYSGVATGIDHLKELGITHVQIQPFYDYATCSDVNSQDSSCYNWGYDPWNYNVPEDRYSSAFGTEDYDTKIKEVKTMVNEFHKNGIRVIMDVVYNHTYDKSVFQDITSKYYLKDDITGCGDTVNANENMVWTMIRDSMDYWVSEYHIDGFRLDLVGAFSMEDYSDWGVYLNKQHPDANLVIYGEPWAADNEKAEAQIKNPVRTGRMYMQDKDAHVGAFNNRIRNCLKGSSDNADALGFIFNKVNDGWDGNETDEEDVALKGNVECVFMGVRGGPRHADAKGTNVWAAQAFTDPEQAVSYITAHDNLALRDKIEAAGISGDEAKRLQVYANSIIMISQGVTFIHGGEEFGRTKAAAGKDDIHNSYNTTTGANDFKWDLKAGEWKDVNDAHVAYIKMRSEHPAFRMTTADQIFTNITLDEDNSSEDVGVVAININGKAVKDSWGTIKVVMNSSKNDVEVKGLDGMTKVADGTQVGDKVTNNTKAAAQAVSIWMVANDAADDDSGSEYENVCFAGDDNGWNHDPMTYADGKWTIETTVTSGKGFKITQCNWTDAAWGTDGTAHGLSTEGGNITADVDGTKVIFDEKNLTWAIE